MKAILNEMFRRNAIGQWSCRSCNTPFSDRDVERYGRRPKLFLFESCCSAMELNYLDIENALEPDSPEQSLAAVLTPRP